MQPLPGAFEVMHQLIEDGHMLAAVTSRSGKSLELAQRWVANNGFCFEVIGTDGRSKALYTRGMDVFLDNDPGKLYGMWHVPYRFVLHNALNVHLPWPEGVRGVHDWDDFYQKIGEILVAMC